MTTEMDSAHRESFDPDCIDDAVAAEWLSQLPWQRMVVVGDSVAEGVREPLDGYRNLGFADRIGEALAATRPGFAYRNLGVRGQRLAEIRSTQAAAALEFHPDVTMVVAGGNDVLVEAPDLERVRTELTELVTSFTARGIAVVTIGLFDLARSGLVPATYAEALAERMDQLDAITAEVATEAGAWHVDTHHHPRAADPAIYSSDRMHCNARGHAIAFAAIASSLAHLDV
ncbi:SGNH/GDSL hydrolase family protein [Aeromicrobium sp. Root236]|uniref:SGNH/GDSL hydrolase family protein n=1 Tax=Aeromicrobium sp. Root236 TaxID=1736498 RepID=UPI0009EBA875|nr:SGNH/GDSL hydrolase family protein [Aeromicrobium sp. Root236]